MCAHHLWNDPTSFRCTRTTLHDEFAPGGHTYDAGDVPDRHDQEGVS